MVNDCEEKIKICLASDGVWVYDEPKLEGLMTKIVGVLLPLPFNDVFDYQADDDIAKMIETRLEKLNTESKL